MNFISLGSDYGSWTILDDGTLRGSTIISAGLGEDASFDVEFAAKYDATVLIVDPTPRAVAHYDAMKLRFGSNASSSYVTGGKQPVEAYDLSKLSAETLILEPSALWIENTHLKFFLPVNPDHVSHSIVNFQNDYRTDTDAIEVEAVTIEELLKRHNLQAAQIDLLKLDIEGAEIEFLQHMLSLGVRPRQICVEFDEFNKPGKTAFARVDQADAALVSAGYECIYGDGKTDFLYVLT